MTDTLDVPEYPEDEVSTPVQGANLFIDPEDGRLKIRTASGEVADLELVGDDFGEYLLPDVMLRPETYGIDGDRDFWYNLAPPTTYFPTDVADQPEGGPAISKGPAFGGNVDVAPEGGASYDGISAYHYLPYPGFATDPWIPADTDQLADPRRKDFTLFGVLRPVSWSEEEDSQIFGSAGNAFSLQMFRGLPEDGMPYGSLRLETQGVNITDPLPLHDGFNVWSIQYTGATDTIIFTVGDPASSLSRAPNSYPGTFGVNLYLPGDWYIGAGRSSYHRSVWKAFDVFLTNPITGGHHDQWFNSLRKLYEHGEDTSLALRSPRNLHPYRARDISDGELEVWRGQVNWWPFGTGEDDNGYFWNGYVGEDYAPIVRVEDWATILRVGDRVRFELPVEGTDNTWNGLASTTYEGYISADSEIFSSGEADPADRYSDVSNIKMGSADYPPVLYDALGGSEYTQWEAYSQSSDGTIGRMIVYRKVHASEVGFTPTWNFGDGELAPGGTGTYDEVIVGQSVQDAVVEVRAFAEDHAEDPTDAHNTSALTYTPVGANDGFFNTHGLGTIQQDQSQDTNFSVQGVIRELDRDVHLSAGHNAILSPVWSSVDEVADVTWWPYGYPYPDDPDYFGFASGWLDPDSGTAFSAISRIGDYVRVVVPAITGSNGAHTYWGTIASYEGPGQRRIGGMWMEDFGSVDTEWDAYSDSLTGTIADSVTIYRVMQADRIAFFPHLGWGSQDTLFQMDNGAAAIFFGKKTFTVQDAILALQPVYAEDAGLDTVTDFDFGDHAHLGNSGLTIRDGMTMTHRNTTSGDVFHAVRAGGSWASILVGNVP